MSWRSAPIVLVLIAAAVLLSTLAGAARSAEPVSPARLAGDPAKGRLVWISSGCGACHRFTRAGTTGTAGPNIDRWLVPHAMRAKMPVELFALSRVTWGGRGMLAYRGVLEPQEIDDVVAFVIGRPFSAPSGGVGPARQFTIPPLETASDATVARWIRRAGLPTSALRGARLFALEGCLSCHTYLGSGTRRYGARDLTREGATARSRAFLRRYVARPYAFGNTLMPSYTDLSKTNVEALAEFLKESKGRIR
jgi:cytochrome c2